MVAEHSTNSGASLCSGSNFLWIADRGAARMLVSQAPVMPKLSPVSADKIPVPAV
jgi:hypothetical protein